jgi:N-acetylglucosaminyldiphosphoundecaprenol N-acetyl-beta-D-mannosaminyltransferase
MKTSEKKFPLMGIEIDNVTMDETLIRINDLILSKRNSFILTPNVDHIMKVQKDIEFKNIYDNADLVVADGMPLLWAAWLLKNPLKERVCGSDILPLLFRLCAQKGYGIFLLGGSTEKVINETIEKLAVEFPDLKVCGYESPAFGFEKDEAESNRLINKIQKSDADILIVGVGAPKQEKWIFNHKNKYGASLSIGVGASIDFYSGNKKRAPVWMQHSGLEWFYRFLQEPGRMFKRYFIDDMQFFGLLFKEWKSRN